MASTGTNLLAKKGSFSLFLSLSLSFSLSLCVFSRKQSFFLSRLYFHRATGGFPRNERQFKGEEKENSEEFSILR